MDAHEVGARGFPGLHDRWLISFLIDGRSTILICGPRGAGKSSLLAATLFEFHRTQRILTIEDTPELPVRQMQSLGFKV
jgi:type IV secretory pathway ATPase VirB11/archaellum biosynthesis ATPase